MGPTSLDLSVQTPPPSILYDVQVRERLCSESWEGRIAAGDCLGLIAAHCQHNTVADMQAAVGHVIASSEEHDARDPIDESDTAALSLEGFNIDRVLQHGTQLLASGGTVSQTALPAVRLLGWLAYVNAHVKRVGYW
jgi:hypothetical protein